MGGLRHPIPLRVVLCPRPCISTRDGGSVSVNIGIFWGIGIGWIKIHSICIDIGIFGGICIGKNNTDPPSLVSKVALSAQWINKPVYKNNNQWIDNFSEHLHFRHIFGKS